jgi:hypothetical protein
MPDELLSQADVFSSLMTDIATARRQYQEQYEDRTPGHGPNWDARIRSGPSSLMTTPVPRAS